MKSALRTENLCKQFWRVEALRGLNLVVPQGSVFALVGPNGAGKTTAIKILMNILRATNGYAEVLETESTQLNQKQFISIGYVSENQELPDWMRVDAFLAFLRPFYPSWDVDLENELVRQFDLPLKRKLRNLSRGMRMKAALTSALAYHPKLIVLDEPFTGLDPLVRDELIQGLLDRAQESTILISSHDLAEIESFASNIAYLEKGRLRFSEELTSLLDRFREVELTFDTSPPLPRSLPDTWMQVNASAAVVRFIESRFDSDRTVAQVRSVIGEAKNVTFSPMSLRSIFLVMAKSGKDGI